jgi:ubiquinone/menaquinone biosynthesis C-methylase UbiE
MGKAAARSRKDPLGEQRFAGKLSADYALWRLARPFLDDVHATITHALGQFARSRPGPLRALDIGMGDGAITKLLLAEPKLDVTGIDNEPTMLDQAREALVDETGGGRLKIVLADALHFLAEQPPRAFDVIASGYVLHNLTADYRQRLYGEIWRVLAPSGILINADKYAQGGEAHRAALRWQLGLFFDVLNARERQDLLRDWVLHYVEDEAADRVMPEDSAIQDLERLGFADVRIVYRRHMDAVLVAKKPGEARA